MKIALLLAAVLAAQAPAANYRAEIEKYRSERVAELTAPSGWLAVQGLFWLHEGQNVAGSDAAAEIRLPARVARRLGVFTMTGGAVSFTPDPSARVTISDKPLDATYTFPQRGGEQAAIVSEGVSLFVIRRADRVGLRMLDPDSAARKGFRGLRYFPLDAAYRFRARFVPYEKLKPVPVPNVLGQLVTMESPGYVEFTLKGKTYRLEPVYETPRHDDLFFIFKDLTSRSDTYEAGRFLHTPLPKDGIVDLDFNRAYNPPCAFTDFATCPLPVKENQLPVALKAGELRFHLVK